MKNDVQVKKKMGDVLCDIGKYTDSRGQTP